MTGTCILRPDSEEGRNERCVKDVKIATNVQKKSGSIN